MRRQAQRLGLALGLALALGACAGPGPVGLWALGPVGGPGASVGPSGAASLVLRLGGERQLQALARAWKPADVHSYRVQLSWYDPSTAGYRAFTPPRSSQVAAADGVASFGALDPKGRYLAIVEVWGAPGGQAATQQLNRQRPAHVIFDLALGQRERTVELPLDDVAFGATLRLPSRARRAEEVPPWVQRIEVSLRDEDASGALLLRRSYLPEEPMRLTDLRGDRRYGVELVAVGEAGQSTVRLSGWRTPKLEGENPVLDAEFAPWVPPSGAQVANLRPPGGGGNLAMGPSFGWVALPFTMGVAAFDPASRRFGLPVTLPSGVGQVAVGPQGQGPWVGLTTRQAIVKLNAQGAVGPEKALGAAPGELWPTADGGLWVALPSLKRAVKLEASGDLGASFPTGATPGAIATPPQGSGLWVAYPEAGKLGPVGPQGALAGPFTVGPRPGRFAWGPDGSWWVPCGDGSLHRLRPDGQASGAPLALGGEALAIAWRSDGQAAWAITANPNRLLRLAPDGRTLSRLSLPMVPAGLSLGPDHGPWVTGQGQLVGHSP